MVWQTIAAQWLAQAAVAGLIVLFVGSAAVALCRQPVRRARLVVLTLLGALVVPWLGMLPLMPRWSAPFFGTTFAADDQAGADRAGLASVIPGGGAPESLPAVNEVGGSHLGKNETAMVALDGPGDPEPVRAVGAKSSRAARVAWPRLVVATYAAVSIGLVAWWLLGQALLWRIDRAARPAPGRVRALFLGISGPAGEQVRLRESDRIRLPFTFTWIRPVILVPAALGDEDDAEALRYGLAHEWSHVEQRDAWAWNLVCLAGSLLFYQPMFWWLKRQLRLCQDYLADDRAAAFGSPEDYAAYLVRFARYRSAGPAQPALGIGDRRSNLYQRVLMLVHQHEPLERRCQTGWTMAVTLATLVAVVAASGIRLDAARVDDEKVAPADKASSNDEPLGDKGNVDGGATGEIVTKVQFEGNLSNTRNKIRGKILTREGQPFDAARIEGDINRLLGTKWYTDVKAYRERDLSGTGVIITFKVVEMPVLTHVEFRGRAKVSLEEIQESTGLKVGSRADGMRVRLAISQIKQLYGEKGFEQTEVTLIEGGQPGETRVIYRIVEGPNSRVVVRYESPIVIARAITKNGQPVKGLIFLGMYTAENQDPSTKAMEKKGMPSAIQFNKQEDGRFRSEQVIPDRALEITAHAAGFKPESRIIRLPEGATAEVTFVLEPDLIGDFGGRRRAVRRIPLQRP